jgi:GxxExxY protein
LELRGLTVERQVVVPVVYKGKRLETQLRVDLIVVARVVVECKAVSTYNSVFAAQVLTYLRQLDLKLGLVINFGERLVKDGIHRVVNGL